MMQGSNASTGAMRRQGSWCWKGLQITGLLQIILGCLAVLFGIVSIIAKAGLYFIGTPIWCGICFFTVAGILGLGAGLKRGTGLVVGYMVMSIISSVAAFAIVCSTGAVIHKDMYRCLNRHQGSYLYSRSCSTSQSARVVIDSCVLLIGIAEFVISIVGASFTCFSLHSSRSTQHTLVTYRACPQQMIIGAPPQGVYFPTATVAYPNQIVLQPTQPSYQPLGQFQPLPQGQFQPLPQGQFQPLPQGHVFQPLPQEQFKPLPQMQFQPPPQGQFQPPPQGQFQPQTQEKDHPEESPHDEEDHSQSQPLTNSLACVE